MKYAIWVVVSALSLLTFLACGSGGVIPPPPIVVSITPDTAHVVVTQSVQFEATVYNTADGTVTWSLSGAGCTGAACGTLSNTGLYTAPASVPNPAVVTVKATSFADTSKWASVDVTIVTDTNLWTWISGSDAADQGGIYGIKGVPAPTNVPGARYGAASWIDLQGRLWLFGGASFSDLWRYDPTSHEWTWVSGNDTYVQGGNYGTKGIASPSNFPGGKDGAASWIDSQGLFWLFGGKGVGRDMGYSGTIGSLNDVWTFDPTTLEWTWVAGSDSVIQPGVYGTKGAADPSNVIGSRYGAVSWLDPEGRIWIFGGRGRDSAGVGDHLLNDLWRFDPTTLEWIWMSGSDIAEQAGSYGTRGLAAPSNVPGARDGAVSWIDPQGHLWLFGGQGMDSASRPGGLNDLWTYDPETFEWTWISGSKTVNQAGVYGVRGTSNPSNFPGARGGAISWLDSGGTFWLFGGGGADSVGGPIRLNDLWSLDPTTLLWTWMAGSDGWDQLGSYGTQGVVNWSSTPGARAGATPWIDAHGNLWLFGGGGFATTTTEGGLNDLWKFVR